MGIEQRMIEAGWKDIKEVPKDGSYVIRWNIVFGAPIIVMYRYDKDGYHWWNEPTDTSWLESSFLPYYYPCPDNPLML